MKFWTMPSIALIALAATIAGCGGANMDNALSSITADDLIKHIKTLASDEYEGRFPGTPGGEKTERYLVSQFQRIGLKPGNGDSFLQEVPLVEITANPNADLVIAGRGRAITYKYGSSFAGGTRRVVDAVQLDQSDVVFVGYGIVAPEYEWDDYANVDVTGKTVIMLVNDPGFATQDESLFRGNAMTYYGRWTYKFEEAARQGAAAAIIVHETAPAGYPWSVVENGWTGPQSYLKRQDNNLSRSAVEGWITHEAARSIFTMAGRDYEADKKTAVSREFRALPLGLSASVAIQNEIRRSRSNNVAAVLPGTTRPDEVVIFVAHWDHLGRDESLDGDQIYNGARDNAMGTAALIELAQAFTRVAGGMDRSIMFLAVTAEEQGLLGSAYYASDPLYPLEKTVGAINIDASGIWGRTKDVTVVGMGNSELDEYVKAAARAQGRTARAESEPEKGYFFRSDHFSFAKAGVPALYVDNGHDSVEYGPEWGKKQSDEWTSVHYHRPSDEYDDTWDLSGFVEDLQLLLRVGYELAVGSDFPEWSKQSAFRSVRESYMNPPESS